MSIILTITAVVLGAFRLCGLKSEPFQAIAHVYVGALFGAYLVGRRRLYLVLAVALTVLEVIAFVAFRFGFLPFNP